MFAGTREATRAALATPALRRVQLAWSTSQIGSWGSFVALSVYAYDAGGASAVGVAAFARMVPAGLAAPLGGVLVDRHSRRNVVLWSLVVRAVLLGAIAAAVAVSAPLAVVLALAALATVAGTVHRPGQGALLTTLAETPAQLAASNANWSGLDNAAFLVGSLPGGVFIATAGVGPAFAATAALHALATAPMALVAADPVPEHRERDAAASALAEARTGIREVWTHRGLRVVVGILAISTLVEGAVDVLVVVLAIDVLELADASVGWLNACWGVGGFAGGAAALAVLRGGRLAIALAAGGLLVGLSVMAAGAASGAVMAGALIVALGVGYALIEVAGLSLLQRLSADDLLGRAFAVVEGSYWVTTGLGALAAPVAVALLGARGALVAVGAVLPIAIALRWVALAHLEAGVPVPEAQFRALRAVPAFAPLPIATVETVAQRLVPVSVPAGEAVIREGEPGERFYVVAAGRADVTLRGRPLDTRGPGEFFGEIALLRDTPRTATVTAGTDPVRYALGRDAVAAAGGAPPRPAGGGGAAGGGGPAGGGGGGGGARGPRPPPAARR